MNRDFIDDLMKMVASPENDVRRDTVTMLMNLTKGNIHMLRMMATDRFTPNADAAQQALIEIAEMFDDETQS